jgi:hypothetical protein
LTVFCPRCKDEFRPGFTRCAGCGVDLVDSLDAIAPEVAPARTARPATTPAAMREYCGFLALDDAREQRDRLRANGIQADILIREAPDSGDAFEEEYWLRVDGAAWARASRILDAGVDETDEPAPFACDRCGTAVTEEDDRCPKCGARFDE